MIKLGPLLSSGCSLQAPDGGHERKECRSNTPTLTRKWHNFNGLVGFAVNLLFLGF